MGGDPFWMFVYTKQPLSNRLYNRFDNRLYRINGVSNFARCLAVSCAGSALYIHFRGLLPPNGILPVAKCTLCPSLALSYIGSITAWHFSSGHHPNFAALSRGHHLYSAGWPSHWASAHMLVVIQFCVITRTWLETACVYSSYTNTWMNITVYIDIWTFDLCIIYLWTIWHLIWDFPLQNLRVKESKDLRLGQMI